MQKRPNAFRWNKSGQFESQAIATRDLNLADPIGVRTRLSWFLLVRIIVISILLVSLVGLRLGKGQSIFGVTDVILYTVCGFSYASILAGALWLRYQANERLIALCYLQLIGDAFVAAVLVVTTGGIESAFVFLFSLTILSAAAVLDKRASIYLAVVSSLFLVLILGAQFAGFLIPIGVESPNFLTAFPAILANVLAFFLVAVLAGSLTDQITQSRRSLTKARRNLLQFEKLHETVLEQLPTGVITLSEDDEIVFLNRAAERILGLSFPSVQQSVLGDWVPELDRARRSASQFEVVREYMGVQQVLGGAVSRLGGFGFTYGTVIAIEDLTELRSLQEIARQSDRLQTLGRFAAGMAHEIRNPLAGMLGSLQILKKDFSDNAMVPKDTPRLLEVTYSEANRLSRLVSEFLSYARPSQPEFESVNIYQLLQDTKLALETQCPESISINIDVEAGFMVNCDPHHFRQVALNLMKNAIDALNDQHTGLIGETTGTVRISSSRDEHYVRIFFEDSGPGVKEEDRSTIWEPFFSSKRDGIGLGLALCYQIIDSHHGDILIGDSTMGGALFEVKLPVSSAR